MLTVFENLHNSILIGSLLVIAFTYLFLYFLQKLILWWKSEFKDLADPHQCSLLNYIKFILHLKKHKFEVDMLLSSSFDYYKKKGYFCVNLIFRKYIILFNPNYIHELLNDSRNIDRTLLNFTKKGMADDSIFYRNGEKWKERKLQLSPIFHKSNVDNFIPIIKSHSEIFLNELQSFNENEWISMFSRTNFCVFKIIASTLFKGINIENVNESFTELENYVKALLPDFMENASNMLFWFNSIFFLTKRGRLLRKLVSSYREILRKFVIERLENENQYSDEKSFISMDDVLVSAYKKKQITLESFIDEFPVFLIGGIHVTSGLISLILYELGKHPSIQQKVQTELDAIFRDKKDDEINSEDIGKMKYLECVIKESMRLYSLIPFTTRISKKDYYFGNEKFPKNSCFVISFYHLHKNSEVHPEPEVFNPNRFLPEISEQRSPFSFMPFSHGLRMCIGNRLTWVILKVCLSTILRRCNVESSEKDIRFTLMGVQLHPKDPILIKLKSRANSF